MALLTPNATYNANGVTVNEKIIPDGTRWKSATKAVNAGFSANALYKKERKLTNNTGKPGSLTIHNTDDLDNVHDDGEQYSRATYNENMGSVRVHFYVDDVCAWQNMKAGTGACKNDPKGSAEVTWHAGDGSTADGGNMTSLSMEIIMNDNKEHDAKAKDNGARLAAWLLWVHGLTVDDMVTHTYWVNKSAGKSFSDVDKQCTNPISGKKWCPAYIFNSYDSATALKNWKAFKALVQSYLDKLKGSATEEKPEAATKPSTSGTLYRVQAGAYKNKANADAQLKKVKAKGFDACIVEADGYYKIQVGAYSVRANADAQLKKVKEAGFTAIITTVANKTATTQQTQTTDTAKTIWDFLTGKGLNAFAVAGIMGNLNAESALNPKNLQQTYEKKLGYTDASYTEAVDKGTYGNFVKDSAGYGLAQWTYWSRKQALLEYAQSVKKSIGDLGMQLEFLWKELQGYKTVMSVLKSATSVKQASDIILTGYEKPANQGDSVKATRAKYGQAYYDKYAGKTSTAPAEKVETFKAYTVKVTASALNIRKGPGTNYGTNGVIRDKGVYTIVDEATGTGATKWGKLKSGAGWISLDYAKKL